MSSIFSSTYFSIKLIYDLLITIIPFTRIILLDFLQNLFSHLSVLQTTPMHADIRFWGHQEHVSSTWCS
jgi:hypothetical protein